MTIEEKITFYLNKPGHRFIMQRKFETLNIRDWKWVEGSKPISINLEDKKNGNLIKIFLSTKNSGGRSEHICSVVKKIDRMIQLANDAECLTSPSEYIRECKKWFINKKK